MKIKHMTFKHWQQGLLLAGLSFSTLGTAQADAPHAIGFDGAMPPLSDVEVESNNVYDYTFTSAPTDWRVQSGVWEMTNRWSCSPGWSWFGGRSEEVASIWNKRKFSGDFSVQFYFAFKMGLVKEAANWKYNPANVAISFCGDGKNLGSGYSFIVGADENSHSVLMRKGKVVADSVRPEAILPSLVDGEPPMEQLHRHWWYVKVNKIGNRIECWLDNKLLFSHDDAQALNEGHLALWTYNNGIMLSRVQIFYENEVKPTYVKRNFETKNRTAQVVSSSKVASLPRKAGAR
ncbi:MAG TPA: hypothetical protein VGB77_17960 [Abditibacteriaceae bacterium]|jgi:hypothetical protein